MAEHRYELVDLDVDRKVGITARYADGHVARFTVAELRAACPCATCRALRDRGEPVGSAPGTPLTIADARFHGGWGVNITWNDGHSTGIYPFESLRRWSERDQSR